MPLEADDRPALREVAGIGSPLGLFFAGTFSFPFRLGVLSQTVTLSFVAAALFAAFRLGAWCAAADNAEVDRATRVLLWNGLALSITCGALALMAWIYVASAYGMTILRDTSCGGDVIEQWPTVLALEDVGQCFYVLNSVFLTVGPCVLAAPLWSRMGVPLVSAVGVGVALLFPDFAAVDARGKFAAASAVVAGVEKPGPWRIRLDRVSLDDHRRGSRCCRPGNRIVASRRLGNRRGRHRDCRRRGLDDLFPSGGPLGVVPFVPIWGACHSTPGSIREIHKKSATEATFCRLADFCTMGRNGIIA